MAHLADWRDWIDWQERRGSADPGPTEANRCRPTIAGRCTPALRTFQVGSRSIRRRQSHSIRQAIRTNPAPHGPHAGTSLYPRPYSCASLGLIAAHARHARRNLARIHRVDQFRRDHDQQFFFVDLLMRVAKRGAEPRQIGQERNARIRVIDLFDTAGRRSPASGRAASRRRYRPRGHPSRASSSWCLGW